MVYHERPRVRPRTTRETRPSPILGSGMPNWATGFRTTVSTQLVTPLRPLKKESLAGDAIDDLADIARDLKRLFGELKTSGLTMHIGTSRSSTEPTGDGTSVSYRTISTRKFGECPLRGRKSKFKPRHYPQTASFDRASSRSARLRCGMSYIWPSMPTTPGFPASANAATTAVGVLDRLGGGREGFVDHRHLRRMDRHLRGEAVAFGLEAFGSQRVDVAEIRRRRCRSRRPRPRTRRGSSRRGRGGRRRCSGRRRRAWRAAPTAAERSSAPQVSPARRGLAPR